MTHRFSLAIHFLFTERKFEVSEAIVCVWCKVTHPLPKGTLTESDGFSGTRARPDNDWNDHRLHFDVGKFIQQHPAFHDLLHQECPVFDEAEMASARGHGT